MDEKWKRECSKRPDLDGRVLSSTNEVLVLVSDSLGGQDVAVCGEGRGLVGGSVVVLKGE